MEILAPEQLKEHWFTRTERVSAVHRAVAAILICLLPPFAAFIQSSWIFFVRRDASYQATFHYLNMPDHPTWLVWTVEIAAGAAILWPLLKFPVLQRIAAALLLGSFVFYDFFINNSAVRW
jgi:hypothetical protein